ncbi:MAG: ChaN family lipoprotein, partial [Gammaproteobacteria bacterium]|nr:ChaN family lipoprotein [Gammaproteobacteria bacterium]
MPAGGLVRFGLMSLLSAGLWAGGQSLAAEPAAASGPEQLRVGDPARRERSVTPVLDGIVDTRCNEVIDTVELARRLRDVRVLFIGEEHTNGEFHRVQLRTIEALHAAGRKVIIGLEMFPWGDNPSLERWRR